jgi:hypothetical protein
LGMSAAWAATQDKVNVTAAIQVKGVFFMAIL